MSLVPESEKSGISSLVSEIPEEEKEIQQRTKRLWSCLPFGRHDTVARPLPSSQKTGESELNQNKSLISEIRFQMWERNKNQAIEQKFRINLENLPRLKIKNEIPLLSNWISGKMLAIIGLTRIEILKFFGK